MCSAETTQDPESSTTTPVVDVEEEAGAASEDAGAAGSRRPGTAGRIDYDKWHKVTNDLVNETEEEEQLAAEASKAALGLDGKYASSKSEAEERQKLKDVKKAKKVLEHYQKRETALVEGLKELLGPVVEEGNEVVVNEEAKTAEPKTVRITREMVDAGKRVVKVVDTSGQSQNDTIVLTSDLSLLESKMKANAMQPVKNYVEDAENAPAADDAEPETSTRSVFGVIKAFISNVHNCTILVKCKIISGTIELSHCSNVVLRIEKDATVATLQVDLCQDITVEFNDAPSGKNVPGSGKTVYWGEDKEDRIFHAGVKSMKVRILRDGFVETERLCDYVQDGAKATGKATLEEFQFVTSVLEEELITEAVVREGSTTGENVRAMTKREMAAVKEKKEKAAAIAVGMAENMIQFKEKAPDGSYKVVKGPETPAIAEKEEEEVVEEIFAGMSRDDINSIVAECEKNKSRGNEAFGAGEYAQAILLYSLALDKAEELPDADTVATSTDETPQQLFPRDVTLSNRAACFLKLGDHEKALKDAEKATSINAVNVKAWFRQGLALHAMKQYKDAIPALAKAHKLEPKNRQIKEALQFAEVRLTQEMRKRMEG